MRSGFFVTLALIAWAGAGMQASADSARIAVVGDPSLADLVDVTSAQLAQEPDLIMLDRMDLDKLGQEQMLQATLSSQDFTAIRLVPADGLVLLRAISQNGQKGVFARLVAIQPGVVLREVALPDGADPLAQATTLEKEFVPYWTKLAAVKKGARETLSLLGLRFEVASPTTSEIERSMNVLLANRLESEPNVWVLERWRLNDAIFEKSLSPGEPSSFWTGSSLIDGSMRMRNGLISVTLRVRPPGGTETTITDEDTPANLVQLAGRLADKIRHSGVSAKTWDPSAEAAHYEALGAWCLDNGLLDEGTEAIETAQALGDHSRKTQELQITAYAREAYPDDMHTFYPHYESYRHDAVTVESLPQRVEAARMAAVLATEYLRASHSPSGPNQSLEEAAWTDSRVFYNCIRALYAAYDNGYQNNHAEAMADLRHAMQELIPELDGVLLPQPDWIASRAYIFHRVQYAGLWNETPEATLAFYRENLGPKFEGTGVRASLFDFDTSNPPFLDGPTDLPPLPPDFVGPPRIVAWDEESATDMQVMWRKFIGELESSPDPVLQMDGAKFEFKSAQTQAGRTAALARFVDILEHHADMLSGPRAGSLAVGIDDLFYWAADGEKGALRQRLATLYINLLKQHAKLPPVWFKAGIRLLYGGKESLGEAQELLAALEDYTQWYGALPQSDARVQSAMTELRQTIFRARTELAPVPQPAADALAVTHFWDSASQTTPALARGGLRYLFVSQRTLTVLDNKVWFMTQHAPYCVIEVDPATQQTIGTFSIPEELASRTDPGRMNIQYLDVSLQWIAVGVDSRVFICTRASGQWRQLDLPPFIYKPRFVNGDLYLLYWPAYNPRTDLVTTEGSGLIRVSLPDAVCTDIVSSRRIPPQTSLDGRRFGQPLDLWMTQGGLTLAAFVKDSAAFFQSYATPVGQNTWSPFLSFARTCHIRLGAGGAIISPGASTAFFQQLCLVGAGGSKQLLYNPDDGVKNASGPPLWNFPATLPMRPSEYYMISPVMRGDDLCFYVDPRDGLSDQASLFYFAHGRKDGVKVPLAFDLTTMKTSRPGPPRSPVLNFESLQATDYGLVIYGNGDAGFWTIPWTDLDAYLARSH
jgi:hypothetical protein